MPYIVTINRPGYLPEQEPQEFETWIDAQGACVEEAQLTAGGDTALHRHLEQQAKRVPLGDAFTLNVGGWAHSVQRI